MEYELQSTRSRLTTAFAVAPIAAVVAFWALNWAAAMVEGSIPQDLGALPASLFLFLLIGLPLAYLAALLLACPAYLLLKRRGHLTQPAVLVTSALLGAITIGAPAIVEVSEHGFVLRTLLIGLGFGAISGLASGTAFLAVGSPSGDHAPR